MRNRKTTLMAVAAMAFANAVEAQIPVGYYESLRGKSGAALKTAIHELVGEANVLRYGSGEGRTWDGFYRTDRTADNRVVDRYSYNEWYFGSPGAAVGGMNIEHSFPKSWWGGAENQAYRDLYNLMPSEQQINSRKSNYPMGAVESVSHDNGCTTIGTGSEGFRVWEPADEWKGDFARGYMYMATTYQNLTWSGTQALQLLSNGTYPTLRDWAQSLYLEWARADGVDELEVARNDSVSAIQGNRNPYVDFPNLMEYVWGDSTQTAFDPSTTFATHPYYASASEITPPEQPDIDPDDPTTEPDDPTTADQDTIYKAVFTVEGGRCTVWNELSPYDGYSVWTRSSAYGWTATAYTSGRNNAARATLYTPDIDLRQYASATLTFEHAVNYAADPAAVLTVELSTIGETAELTVENWPSGDDWKFVNSGAISLNRYVGQVVQIGFRYTSTDEEAATWEIRRMAITGNPLPNDIRLAPSSTPGFDPKKPYSTYTPDGRRVENHSARGVVIIRQGGKVWKVVR